MVAELELKMVESTPELSRLCRYLSECSPQPMVAVDGSTHIVFYVNPAFARLIGRDREEMIGRPFADAVPEGDENGCLALLNRVFRTGIPETLSEQEHRQRSSRPVYWSYNVWAILNDDDRPAGVMIQVTDATEVANYRAQTRAMNAALMVAATRQHELIEAGEILGERLQTAVHSRDRFLAVLSHELRNPMTALTTGLHLLTLAEKDPGIVEQSRTMMERQLGQLGRLVDDLLDVSRIATGKLELRKEQVNLATVIHNAVEACRPAIDLGHHSLTIAMPPEPVLLDADPTRLLQIFLNLLTNSAKYSEAGARIWLTVVRTGDEVSVSIRDTGIGIPADRLSHIFDVFVQVDSSWKRAQGGMGIGLSLVREFVELHGGRVEAYSEGLGTGSEFIVWLPITPQPVKGEPAIAPNVKLAGPRRRILVVDDNCDAAESLATMLELIGHDVQTAHDGEAGVIAAEAFNAELVLMDLGMPRLNGNEAARRIRAQPWGSQIYLVALTGWGAEDDRERTREAGFDRHLVKPVNLENLKKVIAEMPVEAV